MPCSSYGSEMMITSRSPRLSASVSLAGVVFLDDQWHARRQTVHQRNQAWQQVGADGVDHAKAQWASKRVLAGCGDFLTWAASSRTRSACSMIWRPIAVILTSAALRSKSSTPSCSSSFDGHRQRWLTDMASPQPVRNGVRVPVRQDTLDRSVSLKSVPQKFVTIRAILLYRDIGVSVRGASRLYRELVKSKLNNREPTPLFERAVLTLAVIALVRLASPIQAVFRPRPSISRTCRLC